MKMLMIPKISLTFTKINLYLHYSLLFHLPIMVNSHTPSIEREVLLNFKRRVGNPASLRHWENASTTSPCEWPEILCSGGAVAGILLRDKNISREIPQEICELRNLTHLDLSFNNIPGKFPEIRENCSKLVTLDLSQNLFVGPIPGDIDRLSRLRRLDVTANNFSGQIPASIGRLRELETLALTQNLFTGSFPPQIGNLTNLEELLLAYNPELAPSTIPGSFGRLRKLRFLWMKAANLMGEIPPSLCNLSSLEHLDLSRNDLTGKIPGGLLKLKNLKNLYLWKNNLFGEIPSEIGALNLVEIDLAMNKLSGAIPKDFANLQKLEVLVCYANQLSGQIPKGVGLIPSLKDVRLFRNSLSGILPQELGLHSNLEALEVFQNQLSGQLPKALCARGVLVGVVAFENKLSGEIPRTLGNCSTLITVQLYNNRLSGVVPNGLWTSLNLSLLLLSNNYLSGELPRRLAMQLLRLEISNNNFSGNIPVGESLAVIKASNNFFSGEIPLCLTSLEQLTQLELDGNQITGPFPNKIISWKSLTTLNLSRNNLTGRIPGTVGSLQGLYYLDLSENHLSGEIPIAISHMKLNFLNLSSNQFSGKVPVEFQKSAYENSFLNNPELCADSSPLLNLPSCDLNLHKSRKLSPKRVAIIIVLVLGTLLFMVFILLMIKCYKKRPQKGDSENWKLISFQRLNFTASNIISGLTDENIMASGGSGRVYRISIERSDSLVAVKMIWNNRRLVQKLERQFQAEIETLGIIRHSNVVKLLCCISSNKSRLLVYEYMENQSLDQWLHKKKWESPSMTNSVNHFFLDWQTRLQIAIGAAQGLSYIHHDCSPPIIHRDVKSSNILLDSDFMPKIADFGLAKTLPKQGQSNTMSALAGSFGYMAPEYAYTAKVSEKVDVYGFGVVLLELTTGRGPTLKDENLNLAEWANRKFMQRASIVDLLDEEIKQANCLEAMTNVFKLGLLCTNSLPSSRPSMKDVVVILRRCVPPGPGSNTNLMTE